MSTSLLVLLTVFIAVTAVAIAGQTLILLGLARVLLRLAQRADKVLGEVEGRVPSILSESEAILRESRSKIDIAGTHIVELTGLARDQMRRADDLLADLNDRARLQVIRLDQALGGALDRVEETTAALQNSVLRPIRDAAAVMRGVRTGIEFFLRRRASPPVLAPQDEEMFI